MTHPFVTLGGVPASLVDSGVYDASEAAHLLAIHVEVVIRWSVPDRDGKAAIVAPSLEGAFSFVDLVSLAVAGELWRRDIREVDIRRGVEFLQRATGFPKPLAQQQVIETIATSGRSWVAKLKGGWYDLGKGGQGAFDEIVQLYLKSVDYDSVGAARLWRPAPFVVLDPRIQAGAPCVQGTRIPTATVAALLEVDRPDNVATDLDLELDMVLAAAEFEESLATGVGLMR
ncbi:MAG: DUF433 domain-containing protein [Acidimicrobiales bacterium]